MSPKHTAPLGRITRMSMYGPSGECPAIMNGTWLESESFAYPRGGFTRRAYVELRRNPNNPVELPYGRCYVVRCSIPDTAFSIPARLRFRGNTIAGFISVPADTEPSRFTFTPEAS